MNQINTTKTDSVYLCASFIYIPLIVTPCSLFLFSLPSMLQLSSSIYNNVHSVSMVIRDPISMYKIKKKSRIKEQFPIQFSRYHRLAGRP
jgi:hypothetical protein